MLFVLECNYIKENMPKYNVMLKDDKSYPYIKITIKEKYPRIYITRRKIDDTQNKINILPRKGILKI